VLGEVGGGIGVEGGDFGGDRDWPELQCERDFSPIEVTVSPQLQQVLNEARQLPPQDLRRLVDQLSGEVNRASKISEALDDRPEAELEYVDGVLVVKCQHPGTLDLDLVEFIKEQREERIRQGCECGWIFV
jgi:hypothetical protein